MPEAILVMISALPLAQPGTTVRPDMPEKGTKLRAPSLLIVDPDSGIGHEAPANLRDQLMTMSVDIDAAGIKAPPELKTTADEERLSAVRIEFGGGDEGRPHMARERLYAEGKEESSFGHDDLALLPANLVEDVLPDVSPAVQIISHISSTFAKLPAPSSHLPATRYIGPFELQVAVPSEMKSLRFKLQPDALGEVEVTLRRIGHETRVTIAVADKAAAETLGRELALLEDKLGVLLASSTAPSVSVTLQSPEPGGAPGQSARPGDGQASGDAALSGGRGSERDGRPAPNDQQTEFSRGRGERYDENPGASPSAGVGRVV